jgi:drug/metabolite transporter (DMT)-like permease
MIAALVVVALVLWASAFVGIRAALIDYHPIDVAVIRFIVSSVLLLSIAIPGKIRIPKKKDSVLFVLLGLVLFINNIALIYGTRTVTAGETTLIVSTSQLYQVLLAYLFLKENISSRFLAGLVLCFFGIATISLQNSAGFSLNVGVVIVLFSAITNAVYFILQKPLLNTYRPLEVISYAVWIATFAMLPFAYRALDAVHEAAFKPTMTIVYIGMVSVIANLSWSKVLSRIQASRAASYLYAIPVMTIILGYVWLRELPSSESIVGGAIILAGVALSNIKNKQSTPN